MPAARPNALPRGLHVQHPPGLPRDPAPLDLGGPADQRRLRLRDDAAQDASRAQPGPPRRRLGRAPPHAAPRGLRRVQGQPRRPWPTTSPSQLPEIREALAAYRIPVLELPGFEADDVIGTLAKKAEAAGFDVVIVTADKDMLQLVSADRIRVFHTGKEIFLDEAGVDRVLRRSARRRSPTCSPSWATASTTSRACRASGQVTAKKWISQYGSLAGAARARGRDQGQGRREPARSTARTPCSRAASSRSRWTFRSPSIPMALRRSEPDFGRLKELFVRLEFHSLAAEIQGEAAVAPELAVERTRRRRAVPGARRGPVGRRAPDARRPGPPRDPRGRPDVRSPRRPPRRSPRAGGRLEASGRRVRDRRREAARRLSRAATAARSARDVFDVCLAQYVLGPGRRERRARADGLPAPRPASSSPTRKRASPPARCPDPYEIANADRWLAERASGRGRLAPLLPPSSRRGRPSSASTARSSAP